jgi:hypothetical protein
MDGVLAPLASGKTRLLRAVAMAASRGEHAPGYEILHDILARPILDWRAKYQEARERAEAVERAAKSATEIARQRRLKRARIGVVVFALVSLAAIGSAAIALFQQSQLRKQSQLALEQRQLAAQLGRTAEEKAAEAANSRLQVLGFGDGPGPSRHGTRAAGFSRRSRRGAQVRDRDGGQQPGSCGRVE